MALNVAALAGDILLASGAEIFRVEETINRIAAEEITEASAAHAGSKDLAEIPFGGHLLDILKLLIGFLRCIESVFNLTGELVDRSDTVKPGSTQRDVAYPGKVLIRVAVSREKETTA